jgi:hypothetical protein
MAARLLWEKNTVGWLLVASLFWEKSTVGWWLRGVQECGRYHRHSGDTPVRSGRRQGGGHELNARKDGDVELHAQDTVRATPLKNHRCFDVLRATLSTQEARRRGCWPLCTPRSPRPSLPPPSASPCVLNIEQRTGGTRGIYRDRDWSCWKLMVVNRFKVDVIPSVWIWPWLSVASINWSRLLAGDSEPSGQRRAHHPGALCASDLFM